MTHQRLFQTFLIALVVGAGVAAGQPLVSVGVKGGVPITDPASNNDESRRYIVGPSVEVRLPLRFAVEVDGLYQRVGSTTTLFGGSGIWYQNRVHGNEWQFPILAKYYFQPRTHNFQPYVGAGYSLRTAWLSSGGQTTIAEGLNTVTLTPFKNDYRTAVDLGAEFTAGVRFHYGRVAIAPEFRYTRWGAQSGLLPKNEAKFMVGISF